MPTRLFSVPIGHTHPQKTLPSSNVRTMTTREYRKCFRNSMCGQKCGDQDERVEIEKEPDGIAQLIIPLGFRLNEEEEEEQQEEALG